MQNSGVHTTNTILTRVDPSTKSENPLWADQSFYAFCQYLQKEFNKQKAAKFVVQILKIS